MRQQHEISLHLVKYRLPSSEVSSFDLTHIRPPYRVVKMQTRILRPIAPVFASSTSVSVDS